MDIRLWESIKSFVHALLSYEPFWTILCGVVVYVACEYIRNTWLDALNRYKEFKYEISALLTMHANKYTNPVDITLYDNELPQDYLEASSEFRIIATKIRAFIEVMPFIHLGIPSKQVLYDASRELIGLSNSFVLPYNTNTGDMTRIKDNQTRADNIRILLKIYTRDNSNTKKRTARRNKEP